MTEVIKKTLREDPIIEALFEIRFSCKQGLPNNLLAGVLYNALKEKFPKSETLDINNLPTEIRERDPSLRYEAYQRFSGDNGQVNVGPRVFSVACTRPYMGWDAFKPLIVDCLKHLNSTGFVEKVERYSLRYINVFQASNDLSEQYSKINFHGALGGIDLSKIKTQMQMEFLENDILQKVSISSNTNVKFSYRNETLSGLMLDIDCISHSVDDDFWEDASVKIDKIHNAVTDIFFQTANKEALYGYGYE